MSKLDQFEFRPDSFNLLNLLLRYRRLFILVAIAAFIVSVAISFTIKPLYRSVVTLYPASSITVPGSSVFGDESTLVTFGDEEATEKILQMLQSDLITDYLVEEYDLLNHYDIDPGARYRYTMLSARMNRNINFRKTEYMSVRISVLDNDPVLASDMANDIAVWVDTTFNRILQDAAIKQLHALESQYNAQYALVRAYEDSISLVSDASTTGIRSSGNDGSISVSPYSPSLMRLAINHQQAIDDLGTLRQRYSEAKMAAGEDLTYSLIVNRARPAEKKALPDRSAIAIISTLSALLLLLVLLIFFDGLKKIPNDE